jgi:hypothetical protein
MEEGDNNGLIRWAKRKIGSMWRMVPTTGNVSSNKRQKIGIFDDDVNNNANTNKFLLTLSGLPLTKLMSYLEPCDVLNCIQTCKKLKIDIDKDEIWYEVATSFSRNAVDAIINNNIQEKENNNNDDDDDATITTAAKSNSNSKLNYRNMAIAMSRKMNDYEELPKTFPESKLNLKDILVVIEMRDMNDDTNNFKQLGSFCSDLTELIESKPGLSKYVSYESNDSNRFSNIILQTKVDDDDDGCEEASAGFEMSSRLIRRDTGKCVCLNNYEGVRYYKGGMEGCFMTDNELKPNARNVSGTIARDVCWHSNYNHIGFDLDFIMERISDLEYKIKSFRFSLTVSGVSGGDDDDDDENEEEFNSMNHFLLFLEGLNWK